MVAAIPVHPVSFTNESQSSAWDESQRTGRVQPIGDLMSQVLARYLPAEDLRQQRSRMALQAVSRAAG